MLHHFCIIPAYRRAKELQECLAALHCSAQVCGIDAYTLVVVHGRDEGAGNVAQWREHEIGVPCDCLQDIRCLPGEAQPLNKPRMLNAGIAAALERAGDEDCLLSFLDADAVVGERFMLAATTVNRRVCYRVCTALVGTDLKSDAAWDDAPLQYEAYGDVEQDWQYEIRAGRPPPPELGPIGNSQFTIRRSALGDLRWNEDYFGRSFEDLWMLREIDRGHNLHGNHIWTERQHAMWHRRTFAAACFEAGRWSDRNWRHFHGKMTVWVVGDQGPAALARCEAALQSLPKMRSLAAWRFCDLAEFVDNLNQEVICGLDKILSLSANLAWLRWPENMLSIANMESLYYCWEQVVRWLGLDPTMKQMAAARELLTEEPCSLPT